MSDDEIMLIVLCAPVAIVMVVIVIAILFAVFGDG